MIDSTVCPIGATLTSQFSCQTLQFYEPQYFICPNDYAKSNNFRGGKNILNLCEKHIQIPALYDCDITKESKFIPSDFVCRQTIISQPKKSCTNKEYKLIDNFCVKIIHSDASIVCKNEGAIVNPLKPKFCQESIRNAPLLECPKGYSLKRHEGICRLEELEEPILRCPKGLTLTADGFCLGNSDVISPDLRCPIDTTVRSNSKKNDGCVKEDIEPAVPICKKGYTVQLNSSPDYLPTDLRTATCRKVVQELPDYLCDENDTRSVTNDHEICIRHITTDATISCPQGTYQRDGQCVRVDTAAMMMLCPPEFESDQDDGYHRCTRTLTIAPLIQCAPGYQLGYGRCKKEVNTPSQLDCPEGFILKRRSTSDDSVW